MPFLTELRAVMDWVWTDTTLSLSSWICVEDIYAHIFILKCWRESEKVRSQPAGLLPGPAASLPVQVLPTCLCLGSHAGLWLLTPAYCIPEGKVDAQASMADTCTELCILASVFSNTAIGVKQQISFYLFLSPSPISLSVSFSLK